MLFTHFCLPICNKSLRLESSGSVFQLSRSQRNYFLVLVLCLAYCWCCKRVVKPSFFLLLPTGSMIFIWSAVLSWLLPRAPARLALKRDQWSVIHLHIYETMCSIRGIPAYNLFVRATNNPWPLALCAYVCAFCEIPMIFLYALWCYPQNFITLPINLLIKGVWNETSMSAILVR